MLWFAGLGTPDAHDDEEKSEKIKNATKPIDTNTLTEKEIADNTRHKAGNLLKGDPNEPFIADTNGHTSNDKHDEAAAKAAEHEKLKQQVTLNERFEAVIKSAEERHGEIEQLYNRMESPVILERLRTNGTASLLAQWMEDIDVLKSEAINTAREKEFAEAMMDFSNDRLNPVEFLCAQGAYMSTLPYGFGPAAKMLHEELGMEDGKKLKDASMNGDKWETMNQGTRIEIVNSFLDTVQMDEWMSIMSEMYRQMGKTLKQQTEKVEKIEKKVNDINLAIQAEEEDSEGGILKAFQKIRWYSINDYLKGFQKYWTAIKSTWETRAERASSVVARKIGAAMKNMDFFPIYGKEVDTILGQQLDAKDSEEEEAMKKDLESNHANWKSVFGPGGKFEDWVGINANKTRGILAWAADHGYLYDIDENLDNHDHPIYGRKVADLCFDWKGDHSKISNYFTSLRGKNASGRDHEKDHGKKMENDVANVPKFIKLVEHEMDERNLWAAAGICERAMERGLTGYVSAWLFTTIMAKLRQYPDLRRVTPVAFFDIIGKISMYNSAFTLGWAKRYRDLLRQWAISGEKGGPPDESLLNNTALEHFSIVEKEIIAKDPSINVHTTDGKRKLNTILAQVFAGNIVSLPGGYIHIFESRFESYRKEAKSTFASLTDPHKEDPDYATEDTEKILLPESVFKEILDIQSTNAFKAEKWVMPFLSNLMSLEERLGAIGDLAEAHKNYCDETREKFDQNFKRYEKGPRVFEQLNTNDSKGRPAVAGLIAHNLLSWSVISNTDEKTVKLVRKQLQDFYGAYYIKHIPPETTTTPAKGSKASGKNAADPATNVAA